MSKRSSANLDADSRHPAPSRQPIIIIADETLSVQAQLSNTLSADVSLISAINQDQLEYWLEDQEEQPDLLLLDQHFVGQQVGLFCKNWQLNPNTRDIDLMVMGPDDDEFEVQALAAGALDYLRKPLNSKICKLRIEKCLQQRVTFQELERLSITDGLTKLANRRYFDDFLMAEWLRAKREGKGIGLIMADIDFFKAFNDHYGHLEGDRCLKQIAQALQYQAQRPRDLVARFGGEEFAVVLPSIQFEGMRVVAERLLETVRQLKISHAASTVANHVTISMGLAWSEPGNNDKLETLIEAADEALYAAKGEGRDRMSETIDLASVRSLIPSG